jgi:CHAT domain-containing protein/Tfp pilus assembly protein PilF
MPRVLTVTALLILGCGACATAGKVPTDARLEEAQKAFDEGLRLKEAGKYAEAVPQAERALAIREAALGKNHPDVAKSLNGLASSYHGQGLHARAQPLYERALGIREAALGKNHPDVAESLNNLAAVYAAQGLLTQAEPLYQRAIAIWEAALGKNHPRVADSLNNLGAFYAAQGLFTRAEPLHQRALEVREAALGKDHRRVADSLNNLAILYMAQGFYARAQPLQERALGIQEAALGKHHPDVAVVLGNLAMLNHAQGFYTGAEPLYQRTLAILEAALGEHHPLVAHMLSAFAGLYYDQGRYEEAERQYQRVQGIREAALGQNHPDVADVLNNLAVLYTAQGLYSRAEPLAQRALASWEAALGEHHPFVAHALQNLAAVYLDQGDYAKAEPLQERALAIREAALGKHHPHVAQSLTNLARLRLGQQRLSDALPLYARAFTAAEEHLRQDILSFSETRLVGVLNLLRAHEDHLYSIARAYPDDAGVRQLALSATLLRKGRSVEEIADISRIISRSLGPADRDAFERLRALRTQLSTLSLSGPGALPPADYQLYLKQLADQGDALETDLARRSEPLRSLSALPSSEEIIQRVTQALPKDGVLIEFIAFHDSKHVPHSRLMPRQLAYLAFLLFADGRIQVVDLGPAELIDSAALRLHHALAGQAVSYQPAAQALYKRVFLPLVPHLGKAQRLFLSPDGQLALVPFAALHDGSRFLVDALDITYLTSGKDLLPRSEESPPARSMVVLADPEFGASSAEAPLAAQPAPVLAERSASLERFFSSPRSDLTDRPWPPLPGTRKEAETIHRLFPHAQLLLGRAATKRALMTLDTPGILHIATHGFFLEDGAAPATGRGVGSFGAVGETGPRQRPPDPLLRSGLVLAGAAQQGQLGSRHHEDSLVTALELAGLDLWGTQLVVLSACDTGRGDVRLGQGVYGLRRALVMAGAESLVTSLWKVDDEATRQLMEAYYRHLLEGQGRSAALRQAMRTLRQKYPHPHFWAPFLPSGKDGPLRELPTQARRAP